MANDVNRDESEFWNGVPGQRWAKYEAELDGLHDSVTAVLIEQAVPVRGERVLDVGCGAGATTMALSRAVGAEGKVLGIDFSAPLLARAAARRDELGNVRFHQADAQTHAFDRDAFDLLASRFGVMFFSDPTAAFRNLATALRPGGRFAFVVWQGPEANPWFALATRVASERLGELVPMPPGAPGPMAFRDPDRVCGILSDAGFAACEAIPVTSELHHPGGAEAVALLATKIGPIQRALREKHGTEEDRAAIEASLVAAMQRYRSDDGVRVPAGLLVYAGVKP